MRFPFSRTPVSWRMRVAIPYFTRKRSGAAPLLGLLRRHRHHVGVRRPRQRPAAARSITDRHDVRTALRDFPAINDVECAKQPQLVAKPVLSRSLGKLVWLQIW